MLAGIGSMQALVPPQMMLIEAVGAIAILQLKRSIAPRSSASGHAPRSCARTIEASLAAAAMCLNIRRLWTLAIGLSKPMFFDCRNEWKPITPIPTERSRLAEYLAQAISGGART